MTTPDAPPTRETGGPRRAALAVLRTEATLFARELGSLFWILLFPTLLLAVLGLVPDFGEPDAALGGQRVIDLYASVVVLLAMIMAALMAMPPVVAGYRESGVLRRLRGELRAIRRRDWFAGDEQDDATRTVEALAPATAQEVAR